jgi:hypothetical protein
MVLTGKIFRITEEINLNQALNTLKNLRLEEDHVEEDFEAKLLTEVERVSLTDLGLEGVISYDKVLKLPRHGEIVPVVRTFTAPFLISKYRETFLLLVVEKKDRADKVANLLSQILFSRFGGILEVRIPSERLRDYHEDNPEGTKVIFFEDLDFPGVNRLSLYGESLASTSAYDEMLTHGRIWYVVVTSKRYGYVVGVTGDGIVTVFSRVDMEKFIKYVVDEVFPLISV